MEDSIRKLRENLRGYAEQVEELLAMVASYQRLQAKMANEKSITATEIGMTLAPSIGAALAIKDAEITRLRAQLAECRKAALLEAAKVVRASSSREHADLVLCAMAEGEK